MAKNKRQRSQLLQLPKNKKITKMLSTINVEQRGTQKTYQEALVSTFCWTVVLNTEVVE